MNLDALNCVLGRTFMYPCAWEDWEEILPSFIHYFDHFLFVDINYQFGNPKPIEIPGWKLLPEESRLAGPPVDAMRYASDGNVNYRDITPAWLQERYENVDGRIVSITRRRGFGQFALADIPDGTLGAFCHCGDSTGESGSNTWYFANEKLRHPMLSNLFDKIKSKLAYPALLISDGSLSTIKQLRRAARSPKGSEFSANGILPFSHFGLDWEPVGELAGKASDPRRRIVWRVQQKV